MLEFSENVLTVSYYSDIIISWLAVVTILLIGIS